MINIGAGDAIHNPKVLDDAVSELTQITGQKPVVTKAKKSIANFKLREGMPIGCKVTLRGERMYFFLDKLITIALPRVRIFAASIPKALTDAATTRLGLGSGDLPRNQLRQSQQGPRHGHRHRHDRKDGPGSSRIAQAIRNALQKELGGRLWQKHQ